MFAFESWTLHNNNNNNNMFKPVKVENLRTCPVVVAVYRIDCT